MNKSAVREVTFKLLYSLEVQKNFEEEEIEVFFEDTEVNDENDTNEMVENKVSFAAIDVLDEYFANPDKYTPMPQVGTPTITRKFTGDDEIINWNDDAKKIHNLVRALGAGRTKINGVDVKILETKITDGKLEIIKIQPAGKKPMDWKSFVNGLRGAKIQFGEETIKEQ